MSGLRKSHPGNPHRPYKSPARERADRWRSRRTGRAGGAAGPGPGGPRSPGRDGAPPIGAGCPEELMPRGEGAARPSHLIRGTPRDGKSASGGRRTSPPAEPLRERTSGDPRGWRGWKRLTPGPWAGLARLRGGPGSPGAADWSAPGGRSGDEWNCHLRPVSPGFELGPEPGPHWLQLLLGARL